MPNYAQNTISKIKPEGIELYYTDPLVAGLKLRVTPSGRKTFYYYYKFKGRNRKYRIGTTIDFSVAIARKVVKKLKAEVALGIDPMAEKQQGKKEEASKMTLREFLDEHYYPYCETRYKAPYRIKQILEFNHGHLMNKKLMDISYLEVEKWRGKELKRKSKRGGTIDRGTVNKTVSALRSALGKATRWEIIDRNPLERIEILKTDRSGVVRWLTDEEEKKIVKHFEWRSNYYREQYGNNEPYVNYFEPMFWFLLHTGARGGETKQLRWADIDFDNRRIIFQAGYTKTSQTRVIPIRGELLPILKKWREQNLDQEYVFHNDGKPIARGQKAWNKMLKHTGIQKLRMHDLRHTFASRAAMGGVPLAEIGRILGHGTEYMTEKYAHFSGAHLEDAINSF